MKQQLEDDLCHHLHERLRKAVEDHLDTCARMNVEADTAFDMATAVLIAEALSVVKADGGTADDVLQIITSVQQKVATL